MTFEDLYNYVIMELQYMNFWMVLITIALAMVIAVLVHLYKKQKAINDEIWYEIDCLLCEKKQNENR